MIRFMDCNHPGVVYTGTKAHMHGLSRAGGSPSQMSGSSPIPDEDMVGGFWREEPAPDFWAWSDSKYESEEALAMARGTERRGYFDAKYAHLRRGE